MSAHGRIVEHEKHLGNYVSTNISDRNIIANVCDLYQRSNLLISDFRVCDSQTLDCLHKTYCMHMYGSELWNLNCNYVDEFRVAWRKIKRRIWRLPNRAHNEIVQNLSYNIDDQLETRMIKFIHMCLNHDNEVCRSISLFKLPLKTFSSNNNYLSSDQIRSDNGLRLCLHIDASGFYFLLFSVIFLVSSTDNFFFPKVHIDLLSSYP